MNLDNYELTTIDYALKYYLKENPNLDEEDIEWCNLVREKVDSIITVSYTHLTLPTIYSV